MSLIHHDKLTHGDNKYHSVSCCIPTHNGAQTIEATINFLKRNLVELTSQFEMEIIIGLDHCTDETEAICKKLQRKVNPKIWIIHNQGPRGKASCLNTLVKHAHGNILFFLDDDVLIEKESIELLVNSFSRIDDQVKIVYPQKRPLTEKFDNPINQLWWNVFSLKFRVDLYLGGDPYLSGACMLMCRADWVDLPEHPLLLDDLFLQHTHHPQVKKIQGTEIKFHSVYKLSDYFCRFIRGAQAVEITKSYFPERRLKELSFLIREIDYSKIKQLSWDDKVYFCLYKFFRYLAFMYFKFSKNLFQYEWKRVKQSHG